MCLKTNLNVQKFGPKQQILQKRNFKDKLEQSILQKIPNYIMQDLSPIKLINNSKLDVKVEGFSQRCQQLI